ncbi:MAG: nitroreductase family protein [Promethearchaeota archaeon]
MIEPEKLLNFIKNRRSIRNFQDKEISDKEIEMILEAGRWAPSASNRQPWRFIIIKNKDILKKVSETAIYGKFIKRAPIAVAIVGKVKENPNWYVQDTTLASMNMQLMAWSLGIGTCWIGSMNRDIAKELLGLNKDDFLLTILPMGYIKGRIPNPTLRKKLDDIKSEII